MGFMLRFDLGLIFSTTGPYASLGESALAGAMMAIEDLRAAGEADIRPAHRDPGGRPAAYEQLTDEVLSGGSVRHVVGAITSWSRKDMIPVLERHGALLWYPCPYEGFETSDHVVYLGAAPNHHMVPLIEEVARRDARRAYLIGSNYVWGWETLRLARERLAGHGIDVVGERYVPLGEDDCALALDEIGASAPDVIVNSLIGPSNVTFMQALARSAVAPLVVSCNQTEADLDALGPAADGMLSAGSFFEPLADTTTRARAAAAGGTRLSAFFATSYAAVQILAAAVKAAGSDAPKAVFRAACAGENPTVLGPVGIDAVTRHAALTPHLACAREGRFHLIRSAPAPEPADPYLTRIEAAGHAAPRPALRIVQ